MKKELKVTSTGIAELELSAETREERTALEEIRSSGFCSSHLGDAEGTSTVYLKVLSPDFEREILALSRTTVNTLDSVRAFLHSLTASASERHLLIETDFRITHIEEEPPTCPSCGSKAVRHGTAYDCPNCGERLGAS